MLRHAFTVLLCASLLIAVTTSRTSASAQNDVQEQSGAAFGKDLANADPGVRQAAAEGLARIVALDQRKLLEGYLLEEKDKRVRLSLQWALYRLGKSEMLFQMVRDLNSGRHDQAVGYLSQLERGEPLYVFLRQEDTHPKVLAGIMEALGQIGDNDSLQQIQPYLNHFDPKVAEAAKEATEKIQKRVGETTTPGRTRPRTTGKPDQP